MASQSTSASLSNSPSAPLLAIEGVNKSYGEHQVQALNNVNLSVAPGEFVSLMGASGCGKSTLLNVIAGLDSVTGGRILLDGNDVGVMNDEQVTAMRASKIGFIFQFFNLLSTLTVEENVALPLDLAGGVSGSERQRRVSEMLQRVGMEKRLKFYPSQLSGGEMQRVAIARALIHNPKLIVADEPTGNLDSENGANVLELLRELNNTFKQTIIMATHSEEAAAVGHRIVRMKDGLIISDTQNSAK